MGVLRCMVGFDASRLLIWLVARRLSEASPLSTLERRCSLPTWWCLPNSPTVWGRATQPLGPLVDVWLARGGVGLVVFAFDFLHHLCESYLSLVEGGRQGTRAPCRRYLRGDSWSMQSWPRARGPGMDASCVATPRARGPGMDASCMATPRARGLEPMVLVWTLLADAPWRQGIRASRYTSRVLCSSPPNRK